jgi:hypothetical protein
MRVMFLLLVLANLMFFGWANWVDRPAIRPRATAPVPALQLAPRTDAPLASAVPQRCRSLGPWLDETVAAAASAVLARRGFTPASRRVETRESDGYWVYIAAADAEQQRNALRQLARAGVRDAAVVGDEAAGGRVSAGVFTEQQGAEERATAVRRAGLAPVVEERQRTRSAWWLDVSFSAQAAEPGADDAELNPQGVALRWSDCPG